MTPIKRRRPDAYRRVANDLRARLLAGEWSPNERIGTGPELQRQFEVSDITIRKAMNLLKQEGLVQARMGGGVSEVGGFFAAEHSVTRRVASDSYRRVPGGLPTDYPSGPFSASLRDTGRPAGRCPYKARRIEAPPRIAERLHLAAGASVVAVTYWFLTADDVPIQISTSYEPASLVGGTSAEITGEADDILGRDVISRMDDIGVRVARGSEELQARAATSDEADELDVEPGTPVMFTVRTHFDVTGRPVETSETAAVGSRYVYVFDDLPVTDAPAPPPR
jgi:GntR family transcriptional regulator